MGKGEAKKAESATEAQTKIAGQVSDIGKQLVEESSPARKQALGVYTAIAGGNVPGIEKAVAPSINAATQQFYLARKAAESLPPGGARDQALRDINLQEAASKNQIYSGGVSEATARLASMGYGGTQAGVGAYGSSAGTYGSAAQNLMQLAQMKQAGWSSLSGGLGALAGGKI